MLFSKNKEIDPIKEQREKLNEKIRYARDVLIGKVQSALSSSRLLAILPDNSKEYEYIKSKLEIEKQEVVDWMTTYEEHRITLEEFCKTHNLYQSGWSDAYEIAKRAIKER